MCNECIGPVFLVRVLGLMVTLLDCTRVLGLMVTLLDCTRVCKLSVGIITNNHSGLLCECYDLCLTRRRGGGGGGG